MKNVTFFTIFISIFGFSQEKFTTQDFGLHKNTEKVVSKEFWNDDNENSVFTDEMVFYNTFLQGKKSKDGINNTEEKYFYNIDNQLIRKEIKQINSEQSETEKFLYNKQGNLTKKEEYFNGKLLYTTEYFYDKNGFLDKEIEKNQKKIVQRSVKYTNRKDDKNYTKISEDFNEDGSLYEKGTLTYENGLATNEEYNMYDIITKIKNSYNEKGLLTKTEIEGGDIFMYDYEYDTNGNPSKITKTNSQNQGNSVKIIENSYSDFRN